MRQRAITSLRGTLPYLKEIGEILTTEVEIDPNLELAGLQKKFDGGPALLFQKVKGYPNSRLITNVFASRGRAARLFGTENSQDFKLKIAQAIRSPLPPQEVGEAPCQEVTRTTNLDAWQCVPMISHTERDPGRTLGGGITLITGKYFWGGSHVSYNRMNFRGKDYSSFQISPGSHTDMVAREFYKKGPLPLTINLGVPPAVTLMAGAGFVYQILPKGCDELGIAGAIQGSPIKIVKAKTVDAYSLAEAEYVIEGYLDTSQHVWESEEAEKTEKQGFHPFHPEWSGYMGKAYRTYKFQATAITHREDRPIYYPLIVHGYDCHNIDCLVREASFLELAERIVPGFVKDVHIPLGLTDWGGVIFQVQKRLARDEGFQKNILAAAISISQGLRLAIAVDEDVDIYNVEDVLWAITTRVEPDKDILIVAPGGRGQTFQPGQRAAAASGTQWVASQIAYAGGIGLDATVPFDLRWAFERPRYPVEKVDSSKWFSKAQIEAWKIKQPEYARFLAEKGL